MTMPARWLLVDDDDAFRGVLARALARRGAIVEQAADGASALDAAARTTPDAIVLDLKLGEDNGLALIAGLLERAPGARLVLATGYASIPTAVEAMRRGAWHYLAKPFTLDNLLHAFADRADDAPPPAPAEQPPPLRRLQWEHMQRVLSDCDGNVSAAARVLGIDRRTLQRQLQKKPVRERPTD